MRNLILATLAATLLASCVSQGELESTLAQFRTDYGDEAADQAEEQLSLIRAERVEAISKAVPGVLANPLGSVLEIVLGGGLGFAALNSHRNKKRLLRGERVTAGPQV